ncbi:hypothetical protein HanIR_Chr02g0084431 [Helianthus annuus]|nr:hypothetical protein HanIR_Chr02g0084431 [Helianthus annuus]
MFGEDLSLTYGSVLLMLLKAQYPCRNPMCISNTNTIPGAVCSFEI